MMDFLNTASYFCKFNPEKEFGVYEILNLKSDECRLAQHQAGTRGKPSNGYGEIATVNYTATA